MLCQLKQVCNVWTKGLMVVTPSSCPLVVGLNQSLSLCQHFVFPRQCALRHSLTFSTVFVVCKCEPVNLGLTSRLSWENFPATQERSRWGASALSFVTNTWLSITEDIRPPTSPPQNFFTTVLIKQAFAVTCFSLSLTDFWYVTHSDLSPMPRWFTGSSVLSVFPARSQAKHPRCPFARRFFSR